MNVIKKYFGTEDLEDFKDRLQEVISVFIFWIIALPFIIIGLVVFVSLCMIIFASSWWLLCWLWGAPAPF